MQSLEVLKFSPAKIVKLKFYFKSLKIAFRRMTSALRTYIFDIYNTSAFAYNYLHFIIYTIFFYV